jgi:serine/threonine protein kinase
MCSRMYALNAHLRLYMYKYVHVYKNTCIHFQPTNILLDQGLQCLIFIHAYIRTFQPANILLDQDYNVKVADFGLAAVVSSDVLACSKVCVIVYVYVYVCMYTHTCMVSAAVVSSDVLACSNVCMCFCVCVYIYTYIHVCYLSSNVLACSNVCMCMCMYVYVAARCHTVVYVTRACSR